MRKKAEQRSNAGSIKEFVVYPPEFHHAVGHLTGLFEEEGFII
jgi:hypothetical protein